MQAGDIKMKYNNKHLNSNVPSKASDACLTDSGDAVFSLTNLTFYGHVL